MRFPILFFTLCLVTSISWNSAFAQCNAAFNINKSDLCLGDTVKVTNTSDTTAATYTWYWGDGNSTPRTSFVANEAHKYSTSGTYTIKLVVTDSACSDSFFRTINIVKTSPAFISDTLVCCGQTVNFQNNSTVTPSHLLMKYYWEFGDGSTSTLTNPTHTYTDTNCGKTYTIKLHAIANGCTTVTTGKVRIKPKINLELLDALNFLPFKQCWDNTSSSDPKFALVVDKGSKTSSGIDSFQIDWGDGAQSSYSSSMGLDTHTYVNLGVYELKTDAKIRFLIL